MKFSLVALLEMKPIEFVNMANQVPSGCASSDKQ